MLDRQEPTLTHGDAASNAGLYRVKGPPIRQRCSPSRRQFAPGLKRAKGAKRGALHARQSCPWRPQPYGERVLVFDTETTTDAAQRLLFGFFRLYERDRLILEGIIVADTLDYEQMMTISGIRGHVPLADLQPRAIRGRGLLSRGLRLRHALRRLQSAVRFAPESPFMRASGRGENRRKFRIVLSRRLRWHDLRIESASGRAAFIGFVPKRKLNGWETPFFAGRFCDLSAVVARLHRQAP